MTKEQLELAKLIERYFGADAGYLDIDCFTLARRIIEAGWTKMDASYVTKIEETKQVILQTIDTLTETDKSLYEWAADNSYYGGKLAAFEISRRLVSAVLTDLCRED